MRLFTGISLPPHVSTALAGAVAELRPLSPLRWSPAENLHITTKFIGDWPDDRLIEIQGALAATQIPEPFPVTLANLGFLPNFKSPKILFAGVDAGLPLKQLAGSIDRAMSLLGIESERRAYLPHVTLARIAREDLRSLRRSLAAMGSPAFGSFDVTGFHLYESRAGESDSLYSILNTYNLNTDNLLQEKAAL